MNTNHFSTLICSHSGLKLENLWQQFTIQVGMSLIQVFILAWERQDLKFEKGRKERKESPFIYSLSPQSNFLPKILPLKRRLTVKQIETSICVLSYCFLEILS